jgi:hypothetical protein
VEDLIAYGVMGVVGLVTAIALDWRRRARDAKLPPVSTIAAAKPGQIVRLVGTIVEGESVVAPITGRACVCFSAVIHPLTRKRGRYGRKGEEKNWAVGPNRVGSASFVVDDGTGRIDVEPGGLSIRAEIDHHEVAHYPNPFRLHDQTMFPAELAFDELVLDEGIMRVGERVVLEGVVQRAGEGPDTIFRAGASPAVLVASRDRSVSVSNLPANLEQAIEKLRLAPRAE